MVVIVPSSKAMSDATVLVTERTRKPIDHSSPAQRLFRDLKPKLLMRKRDQTKNTKRILLVTKSTAHEVPPGVLFLQAYDPNFSTRHPRND